MSKKSKGGVNYTQMQDPSGAFDHSFRKPKAKPQRKQVALLQPKTLSLLGSTSQAGKTTTSKAAKTSKKTTRPIKQTSSFEEIQNDISTAAPSATRPVVDMMKVTEGDTRSLYKALKRKYLLLEEESFALVEDLEKTENDVKQLEEEKLVLLDELLVLEGLAFNPYPPVQPYPKNYVNAPLSG